MQYFRSFIGAIGNSRTLWNYCPFFLCALLWACDLNSEVQEYTVFKKRNADEPKIESHEAPAPKAPEGHPTIAPKEIEREKVGLSWKTPSSWKEKGASGMRLASFEILGEKGKADCSLVMLQGDGGGILPNINRWRRQMGISPIDELELAAQIRTGKSVSLQIGEWEGIMVDLEGRFEEMDGTKRENWQMIAVIVRMPASTLFVKLSGDRDVVSPEKKNLENFCLSFSKSR